MRYLAKLFAGGLLAIFLVACSQQAPEEAAEAAPTETAEEFVARVWLCIVFLLGSKFDVLREQHIALAHQDGTAKTIL